MFREQHEGLKQNMPIIYVMGMPFYISYRLLQKVLVQLTEIGVLYFWRGNDKQPPPA